MLIRNQLSEDETINGSYTQIFLGDCVGIGLLPRGENDPHICFQWLCEDDEYWFPMRNSMSSY